MSKCGILATLHARPGKEAEVEAFLESVARSLKTKQARSLGTRFGLARRPLECSTPSVTRRGVQHMSAVR